MRLVDVIVRPAEEGGFWAEVLEMPGCVSQGETQEELFRNIVEAMQACIEAEEEGETKPENLGSGYDVWRVPLPA